MPYRGKRGARLRDALSSEQRWEFRAAIQVLLLPAFPVCIEVFLASWIVAVVVMLLDAFDRGLAELFAGSSGELHGLFLIPCDRTRCGRPIGLVGAVAGHRVVAPLVHDENTQGKYTWRNSWRSYFLGPVPWDREGPPWVYFDDLARQK